jgi:hypothetical protein
MSSEGIRDATLNLFSILRFGVGASIPSQTLLAKHAFRGSRPTMGFVHSLKSANELRSPNIRELFPPGLRLSSESAGASGRCLPQSGVSSVPAVQVLLTDNCVRMIEAYKFLQSRKLGLQTTRSPAG